MDVDAQRRHAGLKPLPQPASSKPTSPGTITESTTIGNELTLRGIPVVGSVGGAIIGTRPGIDTAHNLEQAARDILRSNLRRSRGR